MMSCVSLTLLSITLVLFWFYNKWKHSYWASKGIDGPQPKFFFGNLFELYFGKKWEYITKMYTKFKRNKVFGTYEVHNSLLFICDPNMIKHVLVKDFNYFTNGRMFELPKDLDWMNEMLSLSNGESWKKLRTTMSPAFSSGKIKNIYPIVNNKARGFINYCRRKCEKINKLDIKDAFGRFTIDVIAESAFGIKSDSLLKDSSEFANQAELVFSTNPLQTVFTAIFIAMPKLGKVLSNVFNYFLKTLEPWMFFYKVSQSTIKARRNENIKRGDFLDLMLEEQSKQKENFDSSKDYRITESTLIAESVLFLVTGYDTTANTLSLTSYYIAKYKNVQDKLREELHDILEQHGTLDYHNLMEAKYLDACVSEALRLHPPIPWLERTCTAHYKIPETNIKIFKNQLVAVPVWAIHRDPEYWPDPDSYNPDRFLPENKANILPFTYMPFGAGPRNCIAMRFALMEAKCCLAQLLINYNIMLAPGHEQLILANGGGIIKPENKAVTLVLTSVYEDN